MRYIIAALFSLGYAVLPGGPIQAQRPLLGTTHPEVREDIFFGERSDAFEFGTQITPLADAIIGQQQAILYGHVTGRTFEFEAATFAHLNSLDSTGDLRTQLAYAQAAWNIARYQARRYQARLRREFSSSPAFGTHWPSQQQLILSTAEAEWAKATRSLERETSRSEEPLLTALGFADAYAVALDTVAMPQLAQRPGGVWVVVSFGTGYLDDSADASLRHAGTMEFGLGYRRRRWRYGTLVAPTFVTARGRDRAAQPALVDDRADAAAWLGTLGYDLHYGPRLGITAHALLGGSTASTGVEADGSRARLNGAAAFGLCGEVRVRLGRRRALADYRGLDPLHPISLALRLTTLRQASPTGTFVALAGSLGMHMDLWSITFVEPAR